MKKEIIYCDECNRELHKAYDSLAGYSSVVYDLPMTRIGKRMLTVAVDTDNDNEDLEGHDVCLICIFEGILKLEFPNKNLKIIDINREKHVADIENYDLKA